MKKYLFGLGAMLFGAGLMFLFTHTDVSAESEVKVDTIQCEEFKYSNQTTILINGHVDYCKFKDMTCVLAHSPDEGISCVRGSMF